MDTSGWELHKENIQPLSNGRNASLLKSLNSTKPIVEQEADVEEEVSNLQDRITSYEGEDPLEPHYALIRFLEHQCLYTMQWKKALATARMDCYRKYFDSEQYKNDKRYVDVIIKCLQDTVPDKVARLNLFKSTLEKKSIGVMVAHLYLIIADIQESLGRFQDALQTLKKGVAAGAEPRNRIKDAVSELEFRIAQNLARSMTKSIDSENSRNFGSSVPVYGEKNDAVVFRNDLQPAVPVQQPARKQVQSQRRVNLYDGENVDEDRNLQPPSASSYTAGFAPVENALNTKKTDKENHPMPSKWNKPEMVVRVDEDKIYDGPREKIAVFAEEINPASWKIKATIQEGVLKERKADSDSCLLPGDDGIGYDNGKQIVESSASLSRSSSSTSLPASSTTLGDNKPPGSTGDPAPAPYLIPNAKLKYHRRLLRSGNEASCEHRMRDLFLKKQKERESVEALLERNKHLEATLDATNQELQELKQEWLKKEMERESVEALLERNQYLEATLDATNQELQEMKQEWLKKEKERESVESLLERNKHLEATLDATSRELQELKQEWLKKEMERESVESLREKERNKHLEATLDDTNRELQELKQEWLKKEKECESVEALLERNKHLEATLDATNRELQEMKQEWLKKENERESVEGLLANEEMKQKMEFGLMPLGLVKPSKPKKFNLYESMSGNGIDEVPEGKRKQEMEVGNGRSPLAPVEFQFAPPEAPTVPAPAPAVASDFEFPRPVAVPRAARKSVSSRIAEIEARMKGVGSISDDNDENRQVILPSPKKTFLVSRGQDGETVEPAYFLDHPPQNTTVLDECASENARKQDLPFDMSNLTSALQMGPAPLLNSTPQRGGGDTGFFRHMSSNTKFCSGNYIHTQRLPLFTDTVEPLPDSGQDDAQRGMMEWKQQIQSDNDDEDQDQLNRMNLSTIQETSKERSNYTTSSSSNATSGRTTSSSLFYSRSASSGRSTSSSSANSTSSKSIRFNQNNYN